MSWLILLLAGLTARLVPPLPAQSPASPAEPALVASFEVPSGMLPLFFLKGDALHAVYRPKARATPEHAIAQLLAGPNAGERRDGLQTALPRGARILHLFHNRVETVVDLSDLGAPDDRARALAQIAATLSTFTDVKAVRIELRGEPVRTILAAQFLHPMPFAARAPARQNPPVPVAREAAGQRGGEAISEAGMLPAAPMGPLTGKVIVISPGHGLTRFMSGRWRFQRPFFGGEVEDRLNARFATHVCRELRRLGATVLTTRAPEGTPEPGISGNPRWEEAAKYYLRDIGMPDWVYQPLPADFGSDIDARPLYANYVGADLLISLHNNIGPNSGTLTLYDTTNGRVSESRRLAALLQRHVVGGIREFEPDWHSLGAKGTDAQYGENHWAYMPSALLEIGFISRRWDRRRLTDPRCADAVGRAVAAAVAEYFGVADSAWPVPVADEGALPVVVRRHRSAPAFVFAGDPSGSLEMAYVDRVQDVLVGARPALRIVRAGNGEATILDCLRDWSSSVTRAHPSHVLLAFGRADLVKDEAGQSRVPLGRFSAALAEAIRRTRAAGAVPVLATMAPIDDRHFYARHPARLYAGEGGVQAVRDRYNTAIRAVADRTNTALVDISLAAWKGEVPWASAAPGTAPAPAIPERLTRLILRQTPALPDCSRLMPRG